MKKNSKVIIIFLIFVVIVCFSQVTMEGKVENLPNSLNSPSEASFNSLNSVFDEKIDAYNTFGFFPQVYGSSLQATYYGLYILDSIGKLDGLNKSKFTQYIMRHYNSSSNLFMDRFANRYLDTDFSHSYYPLSTVLEINSYAILSLSLLDELNLINISKSIDFLWSCYNPVSSGFIGQPYDPQLEGYFKISTMDNTYFAVTTLDLLMGSWSGYTQQKSELIVYINSLQMSGVMGWKLGGFKNDNASSFDSLTIIFEPNLLSSFYSIKTLEVFGMESTINYPNFYNFLGSLYDSTNYFFRISQLDFNNNFTNLIATALGLELSDITGFVSFNRTEVLNFLYNNRNSLGMWDASTTIQKHELIDTFQIMRTLQNTNEIIMLNFNDRNQISYNSLSYFSSSNSSFSLLSKDYNKISLLYTIIESFNLYDRVSELDIQGLYTTITESYYYDDYYRYDGFISYTNIDTNHIGFRSYPIEFYSAGNKEYFDEIGYLFSHKATFQALRSLNRLFKLDDFGLTHDLSRLVGNIIDTQFLNSSYPDQHGGFLPIMEYDPQWREFLSKNIYLEYSYYAIKALELLSEHLGLGGVNNLTFNKSALNLYIHNKFFEDATTLYFQPDHSTQSETLIENTYYAIYILKQINFSDVDEQKIANFVSTNINYSNIKSVYFAYKLSKLIAPEIYLNYDLIYQLIGAIYDDAIKEYYLTTDKEEIMQEAFLWICDMVVNDLSISTTTINIEYLANSEFLSTGNNINFSIVSKYGGTYWFWVNGVLTSSSTFQSNSENISLSLDSYANMLGNFTVKINATALDGQYAEATSTFSVYSDSSTVVNVENLSNCEFLSIGNNITFSITAKYSGTYWFWVNGILGNSSTFQSYGDNISISLNNYTDTLGNHTIKINATALDGHYGEMISNFNVYSDSSTIVNILSLNNYEYSTTGHNINFSIHSDYPDWYNVSINGFKISSGTYYDDQVFNISIDSYDVGNHDIVIWARGLDNKEGVANGNFSVFSTSETILTIHTVDNYVYNSTGNVINFSISSDFPEYYTIEIDNVVVGEGFYINNVPILFSVDGYNIGLHTITIWANSTDKKIVNLTVDFDVFSQSFLEIEIQNLQNYEFKSKENYILFFINASFPDSFKFYINGELNFSGIYLYGGELFNFSIDSYFVGEHNVSIWANSTDGKEFQYVSSFTVYSLSNTIINIAELPDHGFLTTGNFVKFNISSLYPNYYILSIDGLEVNRSDYESNIYYYVPIDGYAMGLHSLLIWAIGEDGKVGTASGQFNVYSNSTTIITVNQIPSYEFMTTGNIINFSINSNYIGTYNVSIDGILIDSGNYTVDGIIICSSDRFIVGVHNVSIYAKSIDGKETQYHSNFIVYSNSTILINVHGLGGLEFMSTGNSLNFSIYSDFPDYYELWINGILVSIDNYSSGSYILYSLDNYTNIIGNHSVYIWAIGKDFTVGNIYAEFSVYSASSTIISINELGGCNFMSTGNTLNFSIYSDFPDYYELWVNGILVSTGNYSSGGYILYSLDNYTDVLGNHSVYIWAIGNDFIVSSVYSEFSVFSASSTILTLNELKDAEFLSRGNYLNFTIFSTYPDYYELWINGILISTDNYSSGTYILYSLDNYTSVIENHTIFIWAVGLDGKVGSLTVEFKILSLSNDISITVIKLDDYEYNSTGNELQFRVDSKYPKHFIITIDNVMVSSKNYTEGGLNIISIDNYGLGLHNLTIWAIGLDGKEIEVETVFMVYSEIEVDRPVNKTKFNPPVTAIVLCSILIIIPSMFIGVSHRYKQKVKSILHLKKSKFH